MKQSCKECPWVVKSQNNKTIIDHSRRLNKTHNCHMIPCEIRGNLWDVKDEKYRCVGNKQYFKDNNE